MTQSSRVSTLPTGLDPVPREMHALIKGVQIFAKSEIGKCDCSLGINKIALFYLFWKSTIVNQTNVNGMTYTQSFCAFLLSVLILPVISMPTINKI